MHVLILCRIFGGLTYFGCRCVCSNVLSAVLAGSSQVRTTIFLFMNLKFSMIMGSNLSKIYPYQTSVTSKANQPQSACRVAASLKRTAMVFNK